VSYLYESIYIVILKTSISDQTPKRMDVGREQSSFTAFLLLKLSSNMFYCDSKRCFKSRIHV